MKNIAMNSTRTRPPTVPPAIAPTGSSLCEESLGGNFVGGAKILCEESLGGNFVGGAKIWASF